MYRFVSDIQRQSIPELTKFKSQMSKQKSLCSMHLLDGTQPQISLAEGKGQLGRHGNHIQPISCAFISLMGGHQQSHIDAVRVLLCNKF